MTNRPADPILPIVPRSAGEITVKWGAGAPSEGRDREGARFTVILAGERMPGTVRIGSAPWCGVCRLAIVTVASA
jgi:hypothetical protein